MRPSEGNEIACPGGDGATVRGASDRVPWPRRNSSSPSSLSVRSARRTVLVLTPMTAARSSRGQPFARLCFAVCNRPPDFGRDLRVQVDVVLAVDLDPDHDAS